jgi:hypothetical protein
MPSAFVDFPRKATVASRHAARARGSLDGVAQFLIIPFRAAPTRYGREGGGRRRYNPGMAILNARDQEAVRKEFEKLTGPVKLVVFSQELAAADLCRQNEQLAREVVALSDKASVEVLNLAIDRERAEAYGVDQVPAIVVEGAQDYGIRFYGIPSGYEFSNLVDSMIVASTAAPALSEKTKTSLAALAEPVEIKVFSTPT